MKSVEFTKEQYEKIVKLVFLGNWVVNANRLPGEEIKELEDIEELVFSKAKDFGLDSLVDDSSGEIFPSKELEMDEELQQYLDEYEDESFWDELSAQLGDIKFEKLYSLEKISKMSDEERFKLRMEIEDEFIEEFQQHGLENVVIHNKL